MCNGVKRVNYISPKCVRKLGREVVKEDKRKSEKEDGPCYVR